MFNENPSILCVDPIISNIYIKAASYNNHKFHLYIPANLNTDEYPEEGYGS